MMQKGSTQFRINSHFATGFCIAPIRDISACGVASSMAVFRDRPLTKAEETRLRELLKEI
jgi:hypothetical protein